MSTAALLQARARREAATTAAPAPASAAENVVTAAIPADAPEMRDLPEVPVAPDAAIDAAPHLALVATSEAAAADDQLTLF